MGVSSEATSELPFETKELRRELEKFLRQKVANPEEEKPRTLGSFKWGVYAFYDYDNEPIYVGQTKESLGARIRRHLTNQRTDAVAMSVLDPFEVYKIVVYPLAELQNIASNPKSDAQLNALERQVHDEAIRKSHFRAILNEKEPPISSLKVKAPKPYEGIIVSKEVKRIREHPDIRIARRAQTIARLAKVISERKVKKALRNVLLTQANRLAWLANKRLEHAPEVKNPD